MHTPDLFAGRTFETIDDGMAHVRAHGFGAVLEQGVSAAEDLPSDIVYVGFSLGAAIAQKLAQTRPGAAGALLVHGCVHTSEFGEWPAGLPVQVHAMDRDPFFVDDGDLDAARALVDAEERAELFLYPGGAHLFADSSLATYDADAAGLLTQRALAFLDAL